MPTLTLNQFLASMQNPTPPADLDPLMEALWHDGKGNWEKAHEIAQAKNTPSHSLLHAYLHRKEGDQSNARYWYNRAGRPVPSSTLAEEWESLAKEWL